MAAILHIIASFLLDWGKRTAQEWVHQHAEQARKQLLRALLVQLLLSLLLLGLFASLHAHKVLPSKPLTEDRAATNTSWPPHSLPSSTSSSFMWSGAVALLLLLFGIISSSSSGSSSKSMWSSFAGWAVLLVAYLPYLQQVLLLLEAHRYAQHYHHVCLLRQYESHDNSGSMLLGSILFATLLAIKSVPLRLSIHPLLPSSSFLSPASFFIALEVLCRVLLLSLQLDAEPFDDAGQHAAKLWFLVVLMVWHIHLTFQLSTHRGTMAVVAVRLATSSFQDASFDEDWLVDMSLRAIRLLDEAPSIAHDPSTTRWVCMTRCTIPLLLVLLHLSSPSAFLLFASSASTTTTMTMMKTMCWMLMTLALLEWKMVNEVKEEPSGRLVLLTGVRVFSHALVRWFLDWKVFAGRVFASSWLKTKKDRRPTNGASPSPCRIHLGSANNKQEEEEGEKGKQSESCGSKEKRSHRETELRVEERRKERRARIMKHVPVSSVDPKQVSRVKLRRRGSTQGGVQEIVVVQF